MEDTFPICKLIIQGLVWWYTLECLSVNWDTPEYLTNPWRAGLCFTRPLWDPFASRGCWILLIAQAPLRCSSMSKLIKPRDTEFRFQPFQLIHQPEMFKPEEKMLTETTLYLLLKSSDGVGRGVKRGQGQWKQVGIAWLQGQRAQDLPLWVEIHSLNDKTHYMVLLLWSLLRIIIWSLFSYYYK